MPLQSRTSCFPDRAGPSAPLPFRRHGAPGRPRDAGPDRRERHAAGHQALLRAHLGARLRWKERPTRFSSGSTIAAIRGTQTSLAVAGARRQRDPSCPCWRGTSKPQTDAGNLNLEGGQAAHGPKRSRSPPYPPHARSVGALLPAGPVREGRLAGGPKPPATCRGQARRRERGGCGQGPPRGAEGEPQRC